MDGDLVYRGIYRLAPLIDIIDQEWSTDELIADEVLAETHQFLQRQDKCSFSNGFLLRFDSPVVFFSMPVLEDFQSFPDGVFRDCEVCDRSGLSLFTAIEDIKEFHPEHKNFLQEISSIKHSTLASALLPLGYKKRFSESIPKSMSSLPEESEASDYFPQKILPQKPSLPAIDEKYKPSPGDKTA